MLSKLETRLIIIMFEAYDTLQAFSLFRRSHVSMADFTRAIQRLTTHSYIVENNAQLELTESGRKFVTEALPLQKQGPKPWREIPREFCGPKLMKGDFYIPSKRKLDTQTFNEHISLESK